MANNLYGFQVDNIRDDRQGVVKASTNGEQSLETRIKRLEEAVDKLSKKLDSLLKGAPKANE
jgi:uncharacterized protein YceH (UPF0502 family)